MSIFARALRRSRRLAEKLRGDRRYRLRRTAPQTPPPLAAFGSQPTLVVVAHPDDEVIGVGAVLTRFPGVGVITVTNGAPRDIRVARAAGFASSRAYAAARRSEAAAALRLADRTVSPVINLGIPDQAAAGAIASIARRLVRILTAHPVAHLITHPYEGGHPDHDATALAVQCACQLLRDAGQAAPVVWEMTSYHAAGDDTVYGGFLPNSDAGPVETFDLGVAEQDLKRRMMACHASQSAVLEHFPLDAERFRRAPAYDFFDRPHAGRLGYERYDWDIDAALWRDEAVRAARRLGLLETF